MIMAQASMSPQQQNALAVARLHATAVNNRRMLPTVNLGTGFQSIKLDNTGLFKRLFLRCRATISNSSAGAIALTPSVFGPHNILNTIAYKDFVGNYRTIAHPAILNIVNSMKSGRDVRNAVPSSLANANAGNILNNPVSVPANGSATVIFQIEIPLCYSADNLTGIIPAQVAVGQHTLELTLGNWFGPDPWLSPFVAAATPANITVGLLEVEVTQEFLQPQSLADVPMLAASTAYGIIGNMTDNASIVVNQEKYFNYPNARSILSLIFAFNNGNAFNFGNDLSYIETIIGSANFPSKVTANFLLENMRQHLRSDSPPGIYYIGSRAQPINTTLYGQVQLGVMPTLVNANAYMAFGYEIFAPLNVPLPGIAA